MAVDVVTVTSTTHGIYTSMYIYLQPNHIHTPLVLECPHSQRTLRTPMRKLHTLVRKCLLPHIHELDPAICVGTPTAPCDPPSITDLPRRRDVVAVAVAPTGAPLNFGRKSLRYVYSLGHNTRVLQTDKQTEMIKQ